MTAYTAKSKNTDYYKCNKSGCKNNISAKKLHGLCEELLNGYIIPPILWDCFREVVYSIMFKEDSEHKETMSKLKKQKSELENKLKKCKVSYGMGDIDEDVYAITVQTIQEKLAKIEIEIAKVKKNLSNLTSTVDEVVLTCCKLGGLWMNSELMLRQKKQNLLFPSGILWDKEIGNYRTFDENRALLVIQRISDSYINEKEVKADINLKPGRYSCLYKKHGYKDQVVIFDVRLGVSRNLPTPKNWQAEPVLIRVPNLPTGTKCVVDNEITVSGELKLLPGKHSCVYSRPDYESQFFDFTVDSLNPIELPSPVKWKYTEDVERLIKAEEALKNGDLDAAKIAIASVDVITEENQERKRKLQRRISDQSKLSSLVNYAKIYYEDGLYYDTVKCYSQAFKLGWTPSASHSEEYTSAYEKEKKRLQVMIEKCHIDIRLGKTPIRSLEELEKNLRQLTEWYEEFRHLLKREVIAHE